MSAAADQSILDLIRPPEGYRFGCGVWVTHDLCTGALVDLVLPALAGIGPRERRVRRSAPSALPDAHLVVIAAADRVSYRGIPPNDLVTAVPVSGRRLHAKFLVLQFERLEDQLRGTPARRITRAMVTSANLTQGGLSRNREIWAVQDTPSTAGAASSLSRDLVPLALSLLVGQAVTDNSKKARDRIDVLQQRLPARTVKSNGIVHSLAGVPSKGLLAATGLTKSPALRVGIVTPAFATENSSGVVQSFGRMLGGAEVDLYVSTDRTRREIEGGATVAFSTVVVREIMALAKSLRVWAVPVDEAADDGTRVRRPLHAKAVLVVDVDTKTLHVLAGSANLTTRGMGGQNRELFVHDVVAGGGDRAFDRALESLDAVLIDPSRLGPAPPLDDTELPAVVSPGCTLVAFFWPSIGVNAGMNRLNGELRIDGDLTVVTQIRAGDFKVKVVSTQNVTLDADAPALQACIDGDWYDVPVTNCAPLNGTFWDAKAIDANDSGRPPEILRFFADLRRVIDPSHRRNPNPNPVIAGKFTLPYERRLPALAQAIPYLRSTGGWARKSLDELLDGYFAGHPDERVVATALVDIIYDGTCQTDPLLSALQQHINMQAAPRGSQ